jgi:predicted negative regulator of RcsB-dependent stress response
MSSLAEIAKIKAEIEQLKAALEHVTDSRIREIIEARLAELRAMLRNFEVPKFQNTH